MGIKKLKFKPLFIIYLFACIYFGWFNFVFYYIITIVLHEYAHFYCAKILGYEMGEVVFNLYGAGVKSQSSFKPKDDIIISLAGPLLNLLLILLIVFFWWVCPNTYVFTYDFFIANLVVMLFNLLPIFPLDGGRIVFALLSFKNKNLNKIKKINDVFCILVGVLFVALFIVSLFYNVNYSFLFIGCFLILNGILHGNERYRNAVNIFEKKYSRPVEVKVFKIKSLDYRAMLNNLSPNYYSIFEYKKNDTWQRITEDDLLNLK